MNTVLRHVIMRLEFHLSEYFLPPPDSVVRRTTDHNVTRPPRAAILPAAAFLSILAGLSLYAWPTVREWAPRAWLAGLVLTGIPVAWSTLRGILRGRLAADLVAMLAILTAIVLNQPLAGLIVVLMQTGGEALERYAEGRASDAVRELEAQAPRVAHRLGPAGATEDLPVDAIGAGDRLLVRPGEMVPCDAVVEAGRSHVDASRLTGEPLPVSAAPGVRLLSGSLNGEGPLTLRVTAPASQSQYARIVELVRTAQASKSPLQRLADRYAIWFTPLTLAACLGAWALSGDPLRVLAVLVIATPCPLILAMPVAIIGGINRAARRQIVFRNGTALEQLGGVTTAVFDKTGTLTIGRPRVARVLVEPPYDRREVLRLSGAVEQGSGHLLARTLVEAAEREVTLPPAEGVVEAPGQGVSGTVEGRTVAIGSWSYILAHHPESRAYFDRLVAGGQGLRAYVTVDGRGAGIVEYADALRPGLDGFLAALRALGVRRTVLLSGDHQANVDAVAAQVGLDEARGDLLAADKVALVRALVDRGERVVMVGDGTNDAPALSTATVGVALAGSAGGIATEAADVVLLVDDPIRVVEAMRISRRTIRIARQSAWAGLGLSVVGMVVAAAGYIPPIVGALLQEGIDVAVILNALRASGAYSFGRRSG